MAPLLDDYEFQFGDDGVLLNAENISTPFVDIDKVGGLDSATYRTSSKDTEGWDGSTIEAEFESKRTITINGVVYGITQAQMEPFIDQLKANFAVSKVYKPLYFKAPGVSIRRSMAKCTSGFRCDWDAMRRVAMAPFQVTLEAGDPIIYGIDEYMPSGEIITVGIPGFQFPFQFNFDFGAVEGGVTGAFNATHTGNRPAPFIARFTGTDVNGFGLRHEGTGRQVDFNLTLDVGDVVVVDFNTRKVWFNGSPRRGSVTREGWFLLEPGITNSLRLLTGSGSLGVTLSVYDAWR
jgi:hypothetical protein